MHQYTDTGDLSTKKRKSSSCGEKVGRLIDVPLCISEKGVDGKESAKGDWESDDMITHEDIIFRGCLKLNHIDLIGGSG